MFVHYRLCFEMESLTLCIVSMDEGDPLSVGSDITARVAFITSWTERLDEASGGDSPTARCTLLQLTTNFP